MLVTFAVKHWDGSANLKNKQEASGFIYRLYGIIPSNNAVVSGVVQGNIL